MRYWCSGCGEASDQLDEYHEIIYICEKCGPVPHYSNRHEALALLQARIDKLQNVMDIIAESLVEDCIKDAS